jgi:hypothetical protein
MNANVSLEDVLRSGSWIDMQRSVSIICESQLLIMHRHLHTSTRFDIGGFVMIDWKHLHSYILPISGLTGAAVTISWTKLQYEYNPMVLRQQTEDDGNQHSDRVRHQS